MIIVKVIGGLGNQLFQYATARRLSVTRDTELKLDISDFADYHRYYLLDRFNIQANLANKNEIRKFRRYKKSRLRIFGRFYNAFFANESKYIEEKRYGFNPEILSLGDNIYLDGFWQTEKYFKDIKNLLFEEFKPRNPVQEYYREIIEKIKNTESVAVHFRRGDYVSNKKLVEIYGTPSLKYYITAAQIIKEKIPTAIFFLFSDNIEWVKKNISLPGEIIYVSKETSDCEDEELFTMSFCKHYIISNSTFSWWGAWLSTIHNNHNKIIIAPQQWFKDESIVPKDIIPEEWLKL